MPISILAALLIILQVALAAVVYLGLRYELTRRQQREFHRSKTKISRLTAWTDKEIKFILGDVKEFQTITGEQLKEINARADKALSMSNDMSRRFDGGEKPKPNFNLLSPEASREARENNFIQKHFSDNGRKAEQ